MQDLHFKKYTFWERWRSSIISSALLAVAFVVPPAIVALAGIAVPTLAAFTSLAIIGATVGATVAKEIYSPKYPGYSISTHGNYFFKEFNEAFYTENFTEEQLRSLETMRHYSSFQWDKFMDSFDDACRLIQPTYSAAIPLLEKALLHQIIQLGVFAHEGFGHVLGFQSIIRGTLALIRINASNRDIHTRFKDIAGVCNLPIITNNEANNPSTSVAAGMGTAARTSLSLVQPTHIHQKQWQCTDAAWSSWQQEIKERTPSIKSRLKALFNLIFNHNKQSPLAEDPAPRFTLVNRYILVEHPDPYKLLGVSRGATQDEITTAYKKAIVRLQPFTEVEHDRAVDIERAKEILTAKPEELSSEFELSDVDYCSTSENEDDDVAPVDNLSRARSCSL